MMSNEKQIAEVRGQIAEVKTEAHRSVFPKTLHCKRGEPLTSDL